LIFIYVDGIIVYTVEQVGTNMLDTKNWSLSFIEFVQTFNIENQKNIDKQNENIVH